MGCKLQTLKAVMEVFADRGKRVDAENLAVEEFLTMVTKLFLSPRNVQPEIRWLIGVAAMFSLFLGDVLLKGE